VPQRIETTVVVRQEEGWHARPATEFARIVGEFGLPVVISRTDGEPVRGDSVLSLLTMGARQGEQLSIQVDYEAQQETQAKQLLNVLSELF
jgi:phosphocarrier protein HPr